MCIPIFLLVKNNNKLVKFKILKKSWMDIIGENLSFITLTLEKNIDDRS